MGLLAASVAVIEDSASFHFHSIRFRPVNHKQVVVQLLPKQQVVQVTIRPLDTNVCVVQAAHVAVAVAANAIAMIVFFMFALS